MTAPAIPPDQASRDAITSALDANMLVEAAAGTGKTASMVSRMVELLAGGECEDIGTLAAVTFTRKAAAELRSRFQVALERAARGASHERGENLARALERVEQCFIGTIHSFCARLLRERPVEAGVGLDFEEMDDIEDARLRREAWDELMARLSADDPDGLFEELLTLGIEPRSLEDAFLRFADYPDVDEWPLPEGRALPDMEEAVRRLESYAGHMRSLWERLPEDPGTCGLIPEYMRLPRVISHCDLETLPGLVVALSGFAKSRKPVQREWMKGGAFTRDECKEEEARWAAFREEVAERFMDALREYSYEPVMKLLFEARGIYDRLRSERGRLNFADLLMKAAGLLRDKPHVRRYMSERFTHVLVDEFQDTDPIQAEVLLLLAASDPEETDWRECAPRPGSLFVVGDPKQSIYRFRRADIVTYRDVKEMICPPGRPAGARGGRVVELSANFRSSRPLIDWVNSVFEPSDRSAGVPPVPPSEELPPPSGETPQEPPPPSGGETIETPSPFQGEGRVGALHFPSTYSDESPAYVPLLAARDEGSDGLLSGVYALDIPDEYTKVEDAVDYEADRIARTARWALDEGITVPRTRREVEGGVPTKAAPGDFMVITYQTKNLSAYARALQAYGIPHQVTGGRALNEVEELALLHLCLRAVTRPDDPVALLAVLRSELFGVSDAALYGFRKAGGRFSFYSPLPEGFEGEGADAVSGAFERLERHAFWMRSLPPLSAIERIVDDTGLLALAAARRGGDVEAGSVAKAVEVLRASERDMWTVAQLVDYLGQLVAGEDEVYDGMPARAAERNAVRVMNLHKAKGLEAPVVFLADPSGAGGSHPVELHVDRSGGRILGYLAVHRAAGWKKELVACPAGWEELSAREQAFLDAERLRLRYVAATRAGCALVITRRGKSPASNPWNCFAGALAGHPELEDPGDREAPPVAETVVKAADARKAAKDISKRLEMVRQPTYDVRAAKEYALESPLRTTTKETPSPVPGEGGGGGFVPSTEGEHGVEWGSVVHRLLEVAMSDEDADLEALAEGLLAEQGLEASLASEAARTVRGVIDSDIWRRARSAEKCLTEVPFEMLAGSDATLPTILRGVIDLAFREDGGWVLVDYKTDTLIGTPAEVIAAKYAPQLELYAAALERATGEPVVEKAVFFVREGALVTPGTE